MALAIAIGRVTDAAAKQRAERAETLEADLKTYVGHTEPLGTQELFGFLNSSPDQVLMWRGSKRVAKESQEVIT